MKQREILHSLLYKSGRDQKKITNKINDEFIICFVAFLILLMKRKSSKAFIENRWYLFLAFLFLCWFKYFFLVSSSIKYNVGEGGVIYVDYDIVTADYSVVDRNEVDESDNKDEDKNDEEDDTGDKIDDVMEHNNQLVGVLKNTLEMQAFLFDKLFSYLF